MKIVFENIFSGKSYFYTIASRCPSGAQRHRLEKLRVGGKFEFRSAETKFPGLIEAAEMGGVSEGSGQFEVQ